MLVVQLFKMIPLRQVCFPAPLSTHLITNRHHLLCSAGHSLPQTPANGISCLPDALTSADAANLESSDACS